MDTIQEKKKQTAKYDTHITQGMVEVKGKT